MPVFFISINITIVRHSSQTSYKITNNNSYNYHVPNHETVIKEKEKEKKKRKPHGHNAQWRDEPEDPWKLPWRNPRARHGRQRAIERTQFPEAAVSSVKCLPSS